MERFSKTERILAAIYFIWFFIHLAIFFSVEGEGKDILQFWPFIKENQTLASTYDASEFLVYIGVPLILMIAYKIITYNNYPESYSSRRHSSGTFFLSFLDEKIKVEELTQKINELTSQPVSYNYLEELKKDKEKAATQGVNGWLDRVQVKKKYKEFENTADNNAPNT